MKEKTLSSQWAYEGSFLKIKRDLVELPNGKTTSREYVKHPGASLTVPVFEDFTTLLIRQYRHPLDRVFWEFPAGKKDPGEDSQKTAERELFEETGLRARSWKWMTDIHPVIGYADEVIHLFLAQQISVHPRPENHEEFLEIHRVSFSDIEKLIRAHEFTDVKSLTAYFWAQKILRGEWS